MIHLPMYVLVKPICKSKPRNTAGSIGMLTPPRPSAHPGQGFLVPLSLPSNPEQAVDCGRGVSGGADRLRRRPAAARQCVPSAETSAAAARSRPGGMGVFTDPTPEPPAPASLAAATTAPFTAGSAATAASGLASVALLRAFAHGSLCAEFGLRPPQVQNQRGEQPAKVAVEDDLRARRLPSVITADCPLHRFSLVAEVPPEVPNEVHQIAGSVTCPCTG